MRRDETFVLVLCRPYVRRYAWDAEIDGTTGRGRGNRPQVGQNAVHLVQLAGTMRRRQRQTLLLHVEQMQQHIEHEIEQRVARHETVAARAPRQLGVQGLLRIIGRGHKRRIGFQVLVHHADRVKDFLNTRREQEGERILRIRGVEIENRGRNTRKIAIRRHASGEHKLLKRLQQHRLIGGILEDTSRLHIIHLTIRLTKHKEMLKQRTIRGASNRGQTRRQLTRQLLLLNHLGSIHVIQTACTYTQREKDNNRGRRMGEDTHSTSQSGGVQTRGKQTTVVCVCVWQGGQQKGEKEEREERNERPSTAPHRRPLPPPACLSSVFRS